MKYVFIILFLSCIVIAFVKAQNEVPFYAMQGTVEVNGQAVPGCTVMLCRNLAASACTVACLSDGEFIVDLKNCTLHTHTKGKYDEKAWYWKEGTRYWDANFLQDYDPDGDEIKPVDFDINVPE